MLRPRRGSTAGCSGPTFTCSSGSRWCRSSLAGRAKTTSPRCRPPRTGAVLLLAAIAYFLLQTAIVAAQGPGSNLSTALGRDVKGKLPGVGGDGAVRHCRPHVADTRPAAGADDQPPGRRSPPASGLNRGGAGPTGQVPAAPRRARARRVGPSVSPRAVTRTASSTRASVAERTGPGPSGAADRASAARAAAPTRSVLATT